ncbi:MAG: hypothetical protein JWM09_1252 [Francisellaceae bacterium]|nr:hypothetical protein [Francisellaceae bacterium]
MTAYDAANSIKVKEAWIHRYLKDNHLTFSKTQSSIYFGHESARELFGFKFNPQIIVFQIVKGGTGKTSIAHEFAIRANLYGARVLCVDLDQQGNLTHSLNVDASTVPIMVDILAEGFPLEEAIVEVSPGLHLIASRIENALLDEAIRLKKIDLLEVYKPMFQDLKEYYDLIVVDCPPNLDQSVAAVALASDMVISPVVPERFALEGLKLTCESIYELQEAYNTEIPFGIVLNKYEARTLLSQEALQILISSDLYEGKLLSTFVRHAQDLPNAVAKGRSIFDAIKPSAAKNDIDNLTKEILNLKALPHNRPKVRKSSAIFESLSY